MTVCHESTQGKCPINIECVKRSYSECLGPKWDGVGVVFLASLSRFLSFYLCPSLSFPLIKLLLFSKWDSPGSLSIHRVLFLSVFSQFSPALLSQWSLFITKCLNIFSYEMKPGVCIDLSLSLYLKTVIN